ncbi:MAG: ribonuclease E/G [Bacteroidales bacterium]|nr:ribonuclease E/G [Bacteroidales bacterium]MCM1414475.1 ribonuclease E/G [bacterium]MCM1422362.1 ribonuclease E/G [bacterium]
MNNGKLLITTVKDHTLGLLHKDNRILSARVFRTEEHAVGSIYVGRVTNISENIGAAFVDIGGGCLTFLPLAEAKAAQITNRSTGGRLKAGDELPVQIVKEAIKTKLAGVSANLTLSGRYAVVGEYAPNHAAGKKAQSGENSENAAGMIHTSAKLDKEIKERFRNLEPLQKIAADYSVIVRTNAADLVDDSPLLAEASKLSETLSRIRQIADSRTCYSCLYRVPPDWAAFVENAYRSEYDEVVTDLPHVYEDLQGVCGRASIPIRFYEDTLLPLYKLYALEERLREITDRKVWLKSGGYLVIEPTEAFVSIDVNTGKYEAGKDPEETYFRINTEAAEAIAWQLRARNLSGIILIDFINLKNKERERALLKQMQELVKRDPVHTRAVDMTALGLMEITRKKIDPSLAQQLAR